jgi:hypothetical protein
MQTNESIKENVNPNKALWEKGDFTQIAQTMRESGESLVAQLGVTPGNACLRSGMWRWDYRHSRSQVRRQSIGGRCSEKPGGRRKSSS